MSSTTDVMKVRLPSENRLEKIREVLAEDEDWRFGRINIDSKKPRFELPAPTEDAPDNIELAAKFHAVVLLAKKNFYQSDEDKEAGIDPKEKRALYILRCGKNMPELMYVSPTAVRNWKYFAKEVVQNGNAYYGVMCEISAEQIKGKQYTWSKPKFAIARTLDEAEAAHILIMRELVAGRVVEYEDNAELDKYEDEALAVDRTGQPAATPETNAKHRTAEVEADDTPVVKAAKPPKAEKAKAAPAAEVEEAEEPKTGTKSTDAESDGADATPAPKGRAGYPNLDDDD